MLVKLRPTRLSWRIIDGKVVVLDLERSEYLSINAAGSAVWELLADGATTEQLVMVITERFDIDATEAGDDVAEFVATLRAQGLLDEQASGDV